MCANSLGAVEMARMKVSWSLVEKFSYELAIILPILGMLLSPKFASNIVADREIKDFIAADDEIKNLPGLSDAINFKQFSGYLIADNEQKPYTFLHYWLVESQSEPAKDPLVLWLNGGPGCSSLVGMFAELGPFSFDGDGKTLKMNNYSWNSVANVLFLESPTQVGFSFKNSELQKHNDDSTAVDNYLALKSFMKKFPQYKDRPLYLTGQSYAGVYLPILGVLVDSNPEFNLRGIAIGNGLFNEHRTVNSLTFFTYYKGLADKSKCDEFSKRCCNGRPPERGSCHFSGHLCSEAVNAIQDLVNAPGRNPYNLDEKCLTSEGKPGDYWIHCRGRSAIISYLNSSDVRKAIHIPERVPNWADCVKLL